MVYIRIYQLPHNDDTEGMIFRDYETVVNDKRFSLSMYEKVYETEIEPGNSDMETCEKVYYIFNMAHPDDYKSRSLSMSDIVSVDGRLYMCDRFGFRPVDGTMSKSRRIRYGR